MNDFETPYGYFWYKTRSPWGPQSLTPDDVAYCEEEKNLSTEDAIFCEILANRVRRIGQPHRIPRSEWFLHLAGHAEPWSWDHFTYGRNLEDLYERWAGVGGWQRLHSEGETDCNLPPDERDIRVQFCWPATSLIFGWPGASGQPGGSERPWKGKTSYVLGDEPGYALLFQVKTGAVMQQGEEGHEAVFRICDEINTIPLMAAFHDYTLRDGTHFTSLVDLVEYANNSIGGDTIWPALPPQYWTSRRDLENYKEVAGSKHLSMIEILEEDDYDFDRISRMLIRITP